MAAAAPLVEEELEFEGSEGDEQDLVVISSDKRTIYTNASDPEIESLYRKWKKGKLDLQPDFQRQFVWDNTKASRLIESALLRVPLPIIYLAEEASGREAVIDGQQRLTSFFHFIDGKFSLRGLSVFPELDQRHFADLDESIQDKIRDFQIRTITILKDSDPDLKFTIFERLNTGAVPLNDMELRNCVYRGPYMNLLKELAADPDFKKLVGFKEPDKRMRDVELVLRFASFYHATYLNYQGPMKRFFNRDMEQYQHIGHNDAEALRKAFRNALSLVHSLFGERAFRRFSRGTQAKADGAWETKKFNAALYDVLMGIFCKQDKNQVMSALDELREGLIDLMSTNEEFIDAILLGTSEGKRVERRFDLARMRVNEILQTHVKQPRCFSNALKQELFQKDSTCALCGYQIQSVDDAAVDHIEQYWRGGKTIPENARLTHRYCNWARPKND
ncbi:MAG: DUF262 domain-containing protein [Anaerolineae bacterium]